MAPEVLTGRPYDSKCDIWSLGVLLYKMATFEKPWPINSVKEAIDYTTQCAIPAINQYSKAITNIIEICLMKSPAQRPTINRLLKTPVINRRIPDLLNAAEYVEEFSHTVLHH